MQRRDFFKKAGMGSLAFVPLPTLTRTLAKPVRSDDDDGDNRVSSQVGEIYRLQAAFHRAKTTQDVDLMMSLWDVDGVLNNQGDPNSPYIGFDALRSFWLNSGSFTHRRFSLVPSFKTQIDVNDDQAWLYFECHDIGDFDLDTRFIAGDTFLAGTVRKVGGRNRHRDEGEERSHRWVFRDMTAGRAFPLSVNHYYSP